MKYKVTHLNPQEGMKFSFSNNLIKNTQRKLEEYLNSEDSLAKEGWRVVFIVPRFGMLIVWEKAE